jgi:hypothetical protein
MPIALPSNLSTELVAVNVLLASIGEQPVESLETVESADAESARDTLTEWSRAIQAKGWHWNREKNYPITPNASGNCLLPANCLFITNAYWNEGSGGDPAPVVERGRKLYNTEDHTAIFTDTVYVDMVLLLEWEEMPEYARHAIIYNAVHRFQMRELTSTAIGRVTAEDVAAAMTTLEQREDEADKKNSIRGNKYVNRAVNGRLLRRP